jgi:hypothetical protein
MPLLPKEHCFRSMLVGDVERRVPVREKFSWAWSRRAAVFSAGDVGVRDFHSVPILQA